MSSFLVCLCRRDPLGGPDDLCADELECIDLRPFIVYSWDVEVEAEAKSDGKPDELAALEILGWGTETGDDSCDNERLRAGVDSLSLEEEAEVAEETRFLLEGSSCIKRRGLFQRKASRIRNEATARV